MFVLLISKKSIILLSLLFLLIISLFVTFKTGKYKYQTTYHPHSQEITDNLSWEEDIDFQTLAYKCQVTWRMAAFQASFPNPLAGEITNINLATEKLKGTILYPGEIFSMNQSIGPYTKEKGFKQGRSFQGNMVVKTYGGGVCKVASVLYNTAVLANLLIIERKQHSMLVPYVPPGRDAALAYDYLDLKFKNNSNSPLLIWAETKENTLTIGIYGQNKAPKVSWQQEILDSKNYPIIYQKTNDLKRGEEKILIPGAYGLRVKSQLIIEYANGHREEKDLGEDYYRPRPKVIEIGR